MESTRCCRCDEIVRVPEVKDIVWVRCPHCHSEYSIRDLVRELPPELEVVPPPHLAEKEPSTHAKSSAINVPDSPVAASTTQGPVSASSVSVIPVSSARGLADQGSLAESWPVVETATGVDLLITPEPHMHEQHPDELVKVRSPDKLHANRRKLTPQRGGSGFVKTILGGIAGLVLGQLMLWWLPVPYRTDPFQLAPKLPQPVAFLAPVGLRGKLEDQSIKSPEELASQESGGIDQFSVEPDDPSLELNNRATAGTTASPTSIGNGSQNVDSSSKTTAGEVVLGLADAPQLAMLELRERLKSATLVNDTLDKEAEWTPELRRSWYAAMCELAYSITFADMRETNITQFAHDTREFLSQIASDERRMQLLAEQAAERMADPSDNRAGILIAGKVKKLRRVGKLFATDIQLNVQDAKFVPVVSRVDPRAKHVYTRNDQVLIAGVIVTEPSLYLLGYKGTADAVVLGGLPVKGGMGNGE